MMMLEGQTVVVTGAARGIGRGIAELFLAQGANVVLGDLLAIEHEGGYAEAGDKMVALQGDVTEDATVKALVDTAVERFGRLDCIVNNAASPGPIDGIADIDPETFDRAVAVVLRSVYLGIRHAAPVMRRQHRGSIINIGSTSALRASSVLHPYGAAKAGVSMLTQSAATELASDGIRVNCVCPGGIATALYGISAGLAREEAEKRIDIVAKTMASVQPLGRVGTPLDVANVALFLASDMSAYVTGQIIAVDGGMTVGRAMPPGVTPSQFFGRIVGIG